MNIRIVSAAVKSHSKDGGAVIYTLPPPKGHTKTMAHFGIDPTSVVKKGFITSEGNFVDRKKAWDIACLANQVKPETKNPGKLYTKDIKSW